MGQTRPLFVYFRSFLRTNIAQILTINEKNINGVRVTQTQGSSVVGADESTELWRHPRVKECFQLKSFLKSSKIGSFQSFR